MSSFQLYILYPPGKEHLTEVHVPYESAEDANGVILPASVFKIRFLFDFSEGNKCCYITKLTTSYNGALPHLKALTQIATKAIKDQSIGKRRPPAMWSFLKTSSALYQLALPTNLLSLYWRALNLYTCAC